MRYIISLISIPLTALLLSASCNKKKDDDGIKQGDCPPDLMCTMEFRTVHINLKDAAGNPLVLDKFRTIRLADGHEFDLQSTASSWEDSTWKAMGSYPVLTDAQQKQISTKGEKLEFRGERGGIEIVKQEYEFKDNCCHIELVNGPSTLVVE